MLIDVDSDKGWPFHMPEAEFYSIGYESISDPYPLPSVADGSIVAKKRDEAWATISPLLGQYQSLFVKNERNRLIKELLQSTDKPRLYITRQLRRYWQRGMAPNALAPDYHKCGAKGRPRREVEQKVGPKRTVTPGVGVPVTEEVAELFRLALDGFYLRNEKVSLAAAKDKAVGLFKARYPTATERSMPTMRQFRYFYETNYRKTEVVRKRTPSRIYEKDKRALTSTSANLNFGPGARYEIDATIADLYLVAEDDPALIIGRPVLYFVKDVFSRMVVGMYVGLENPSWVAAMVALSNAFSEKTTYCQGHGIAISQEDWPSCGLPASIMADRGELLFKQADVLVNRFNIQLSNSRAYRGDDKAICERFFNTIQSQFRPYVGGVVEPVNGKKRAGKRYELDAQLNLPEFTELLINLVIGYNTQHVVEGYDFAPDMPTDLPAVPRELWNWGIQNRTGNLRSCDEDLARINLLPYESGTVSQVGITFKGLVYTCQQALSLGWFDRIRQNRPSKVEIAFDPRRTDTVYIRPDSKFENYWVCELSDRSRRYKGMSFVEASGILKEMNRTKATARQKEDFKKPDALATVEKIVASAKKRQEANKPPVTDTERLRGIRQNRVKEKELERNRSGIKSHKQPEQVRPADVVPFRSHKTESSDSIDYPNMDAFLEDDDD
ncbi:Mu transposase C-terminal domain-containing protein [Marinobacter sp.]|uniref:Mu transposase C-terminal domain-containing protein n=1 Tax=Marinobacter sp. TaxID=50741 RepID=UPI002B26BFF6|nr:Mu transposase C-terminal domain-containing protein [Marinobacter sp.]